MPIFSTLCRMPLCTICMTACAAARAMVMSRLKMSTATSSRIVYTTSNKTSAAVATSSMITPAMSSTTSSSGWIGSVPRSDWPDESRSAETSDCSRRAVGVFISSVVPFSMTAVPVLSATPSCSAYTATLPHHWSRRCVVLAASSTPSGAPQSCPSNGSTSSVMMPS